MRKEFVNMEKQESEKLIKLRKILKSCTVEPVAKNMVWSFLVGLPVTTLLFWFNTLKPVLNNIRSSSTIMEVDRIQIEKIPVDVIFIWWIIFVVMIVVIAQLITIILGYFILSFVKSIQYLYFEKVKNSRK